MPTIEHLESRMYLSLALADGMVLCPYIVPGDFNGDHNVDLGDLVEVKNDVDLLAAAPVLDIVVTLKTHWGPATGIVITDNPTGSGTYGTVDASLFTGPSIVADFIQGSVGDCYQIAAGASVANVDPEFFSQHVIADLGDGTFVTRWVCASGDIRVIRMTTDLLMNDAGDPVYAKLAPSGGAYVAWWEKATAQARFNAGTYESLNGGWPDTVYTALGLARVSEWMWNLDLPTRLADAVDEGRPVTLVSQYESMYGIIANHVYALTGIIRDDAGEVVAAQIYNPWGYYQTLSLPELAAAFRLVTAVQL